MNINPNAEQAKVTKANTLFSLCCLLCAIVLLSSLTVSAHPVASETKEYKGRIYTNEADVAAAHEVDEFVGAFVISN